MQLNNYRYLFIIRRLIELYRKTKLFLIERRTENNSSSLKLKKIVCQLALLNDPISTFIRIINCLNSLATGSLGANQRQLVRKWGLLQNHSNHISLFLAIITAGGQSIIIARLMNDCNNRNDQFLLLLLLLLFFLLVLPLSRFI